ncbi:hypothetical protein ACJMK2_004469, partial [Sinanodonta woodiana]
MRSTVVIVILLCILMAGTDGRKCWYESGRCHDKGDASGKCSDFGGKCDYIPGRSECRCNF